MEELDHDLLPGPALQSSQRGDAGLVRLTVLVSPAVVWVLRLGDSAGPQVGTAHWRAQPGLTGLGTVGVLTARPSCRSSVRSGQTSALSLTSLEGELCYLGWGVASPLVTVELSLLSLTVLVTRAGRGEEREEEEEEEHPLRCQPCSTVEPRLLSLGIYSRAQEEPPSISHNTCWFYPLISRQR